MCMTATAIKDTINVESSTEYQGVLYAEVAIDPADPYGSFKKLPAAILYMGRELGKTCFDSDKNRAYYRSDAKNVARIGAKVRVTVEPEWTGSCPTCGTYVEREGN